MSPLAKSLGDRILAGRLKWRVVLQSRAPTVDSEGSPREGWTTIATVWADVQPLGAQELLQAAQAELQISHMVTIRWRSDVGHNSRLLFDAQDGVGSHVLDVLSVVDVGLNHVEMQLLCQERQI